MGCPLFMSDINQKYSALTYKDERRSCHFPAASRSCYNTDKSVLLCLWIDTWLVPGRLCGTWRWDMQSQPGAGKWQLRSTLSVTAQQNVSANLSRSPQYKVSWKSVQPVSFIRHGETNRHIFTTSLGTRPRLHQNTFLNMWKTLVKRIPKLIYQNQSKLDV
jgi:hypothetical protein